MVGRRRLGSRRFVLAWTIFLHHDRIGDHLPFVPRNCFGDPIQTDLCPANPSVRDYALALAGDLADRGISHLLAEAVHYFPLEHGLHHERYFLPLGPRTRLLLGLCFCDHCLAAGLAGGVDVDALRRWTTECVEAAFIADVDDPPGELSQEGRATRGRGTGCVSRGS